MDALLNLDSDRILRTEPQTGSFANSLEKRRLTFYLTQLALDPAAIILSFWLAAHVYFGEPWDDRTLLASILTAAFFVTLAVFSGTYSLATLTDWKSAVVRMGLALGASMVLLAFAAFYSKTSASFSRGAFSIGIAFSAILMAATRIMLTRLLVRIFGPRLTNELVIQDGGPELGLSHSKTIDTQAEGLTITLNDPDLFNRLGFFMANMDHVIVSCADERRHDWSIVLKSMGVNGEIISPRAHEIGAIGVRNYDVQGMTALVVSAGPLGLRARFLKRGFDLLVAGLGLVFLSPIMLLACLAILIEDGRPLIFSQRRHGRTNRYFTIFKFRTMRADDSDGEGNRSTVRDDDRITRVGRILRRTSIDELPQLFNVLAGSMSVVGPRPHAPGSQAGEKLFWNVDQSYWRRHSLKPGLTGLAQVRGLRGATEEEMDLALRLRADLEYLDGWSLWRDLRIVVQTLGVIVHDRAY